MKLTTKQDISVPIAYVFGKVTDFEMFERRAMREGASIVRQNAGPAAVGSVWDINLTFRGRKRHLVSTLTAMQRPDGYVVTTEADGMLFTTHVDLVALSPNRTRVAVAIDISAHTLTARLLVQSLKLAKSRLNDGLKARVRGYAQGIDDDYRRIG